jgi:hypothetical protein
MFGSSNTTTPAMTEETTTNANASGEGVDYLRQRLHRIRSRIERENE